MDRSTVLEDVGRTDAGPPHYIVGSVGHNGPPDGTEHVVVVPSPPWRYIDDPHLCDEQEENRG
jgi:hypothetical protein